MVVEKRKAIQISPPMTGRESSRSKAKLKTTTTTRAKNIMELKTSRERHSRRRSLVTLIHVSRVMDMLMVLAVIAAPHVAVHHVPAHHAPLHQAWRPGPPVRHAKAECTRRQDW